MSSNAMVLLIMLSTFVAGLVLLANQYSKDKIVHFCPNIIRRVIYWPLIILKLILEKDYTFKKS